MPPPCALHCSCPGRYRHPAHHTRRPQLVAGGHAFTQLTSGLSHTCGLTETGAVYCWGGNGVGQLGDGTSTNRTSPVAVSGGLTFASISAGREHTCGLTSAGVAYCWGINVYGQVGDANGSLIRFTPFPVAGSLTFAKLEAGTYHTCGLASNYDAYCWGANYSGQLGDGTSVDRGVPTLVGGGRKYGTISSGGSHTCALDLDTYAVFCWGSNLYGQLGVPAGADQLLPIAVPVP